MARDNMFHDGEAKTCAALRAALAGIDPLKAFGETRQMLGRDPRPVIADRQHSLRALRRDDDIHSLVARGGIGGAVFYGVFDQVFRHSQKFIAIAWDDNLGGRDDV